MDPLPPCAVTVLCGFLGAGKTTLLRHLLGQAEGEAWALVVNDVGAINLDARLLALTTAEAAKLSGSDEAQIIELGNGCVCCSTRDDLAETLCRLAAQKRFHRILVESTGVAEPRGIARLFMERNPFGRSVGDLARLEALVTVVDAGDFPRHWKADASREDRSGTSKTLAELQAEQIECADLLILNKCDLAEPASLDWIEMQLRGLNPRAQLLRTEQGQAPREFVLGVQRFDPRESLGAARWIQALNEVGSGEASDGTALLARPRQPHAIRVEADYTANYGLRSFSFQARQAFDGERVRTCLTRELKGIVRAKGFLWIKERPDEMAFLSLAGGTLRVDWLNYWWAALVENGKTSLADCPPLVRSLWREPFGDRRQELVFIGIDYDERAIRRALESCLCDA